MTGHRRGIAPGNVACPCTVRRTRSAAAGWHSSVQPSHWTPAARAGASWSTCSGPWRSGSGKQPPSARQQRSRCSRQQGRATGGVAPYGYQFIDGRRAVAPGRAGNTRSHHRAPPRRPLMGEGGRQAEHRRAPHPHRRPVDAPGRPPGPPGARTRRRSVGQGGGAGGLAPLCTTDTASRGGPRRRRQAPLSGGRVGAPPTPTTTRGAGQVRRARSRYSKLAHANTEALLRAGAGGFDGRGRPCLRRGYLGVPGHRPADAGDGNGAAWAATLVHASASVWGTWNGYHAFRRWRRAGTARRLRTGRRWRHRA